MKKILAYAMAGMLMAGNVMADIAVNWRAITGFYNWNAPVNPVDPDDYINASGGSSLAYLIYSPSGVITVDTGNIAGFLVGGDNVVVSIAGNPVTVAGAADYGYFDYGNGTPITGYGAVGATLWSRVIDMSAPSALFQYFDGPSVSAAAYNPAQPSLLDVNGQSPAGAAIGSIGDRMIAVVPEPSVLAFLAIGGIAVAIRRRKMA